MKIFRFLTIGILLFGFIGCGQVSQKDYDALKVENESLKKELEDLKFGADRLLGQAKNYIENKDFNSAKKELLLLLERHSVSQQATEGKELLTLVEHNIEEQKIAEEKARIEREKKAENERLAKEKAERDRIANATKKMRTKKDDVRGITWYYDKSTPQYTNYNSFHVYMGKREDGVPWLRFRIQYAADDWLFIQSYIIKTDNDTYTINTSYGEVETDNGYGGIWEWYEVAMDNKLYNIVKDVIKSQKVTLRHNGKQYYKDRTISAKEKQGLQNVLDAYEALGGTFKF